MSYEQWLKPPMSMVAVECEQCGKKRGDLQPQDSCYWLCEDCFEKSPSGKRLKERNKAMKQEELFLLIGTVGNHRGDQQTVEFFSSFELAVKERDRLREQYGHGELRILKATEVSE